MFQEWQFKGESTANPRLALHLDIATHQPGQVVGDCQAQSTAAVRSGRGAVCLFKREKQAWDLRCRYAGVADPEEIIGVRAHFSLI